MYQILIIEDEQLIRENLAELLKLLGYKTITAANGLKGVEMAIETKPDLILCDVMMPKMDGFEVAKILRAQEDLFTTPFIFLTARTTTEDFRKGMRFGADDYLPKPFELGDLKATIERQFKKIEFQKSRALLQKHLGETAGFKENKRKIEELNDSLNSALNIQMKVLPSKELLNSLLPEHFVLSKPRDIVSGDTFWAKSVHGKTIIAAMDCTGHGVPGALLTMICHSKLNTAVSEYGLTSPAEILAKVNELVTNFFGMGDRDTLGMDVIICSIDEANREITFSGAKRPLYVVKNVENQDQIISERAYVKVLDKAKCLIEIKGTPFGIGSATPKAYFEDTKFKYESQDTIYLTSDGYSDQFGGERGKKLLSKNFRKILHSIQPLNLTEQMEYLSESLTNWKGELEQTDDVLVIGLRL